MLQCLVGYFIFDLLCYFIIFNSLYFLHLFSVFIVASCNYCITRREANSDSFVPIFRFGREGFIAGCCRLWAFCYIRLSKLSCLSWWCWNRGLKNLLNFVRKKCFLTAGLIDLICYRLIGLMTFFLLFLLIGLRFDFVKVCMRFSCSDQLRMIVSFFVAVLMIVSFGLLFMNFAGYKYFIRLMVC